MQIEDSSYYLRNPLLGDGAILDRLISSWRERPESNWMPLTWILAISIQSIFGLSAAAFHIASVTLHIINSLFVLQISQKLRLSLIQVSLIVGAFALHPLQVESIAWASSLKGPLSACFALITLNIVLHQSLRNKTLWIGISFTLSLLCKQTLLTLPLALVLLSQIDTTNLRKDLVRYTLLFFLSIAGGLAAMYANHDHQNIHQLDHIWEYPLRAISALGHYTQKVIIPTQLHPEYTLANSSFLLTLLGTMVILFTLWLFYKKHPSAKHLLLFIVLLLPILGWLASPLEFAADRLIYFPLIFILIAASMLLPSIKNTKLAITLVILYCSGLALLSRNQLPIWKSDEALCLHTLKHSPKHFFAKINLGLTYARASKFTQAEKVLRECVLENPSELEAIRSLSQVLLTKRKIEDAIKVVQIAVTNNPSDNDFLILLALTYRDAGKNLKAQQSLHKVLTTEPNHPIANALVNKLKKAK